MTITLIDAITDLLMCLQTNRLPAYKQPTNELWKPGRQWKC